VPGKGARGHVVALEQELLLIQSALAKEHH